MLGKQSRHARQAVRFARSAAQQVRRYVGGCFRDLRVSAGKKKPQAATQQQPRAKSRVRSKPGKRSLSRWVFDSLKDDSNREGAIPFLPLLRFFPGDDVAHDKLDVPWILGGRSP